MEKLEAAKVRLGEFMFFFQWLSDSFLHTSLFDHEINVLSDLVTLDWSDK